MPVCHPTPLSRATGAAWRTGSTGHEWVASTQCMSPQWASSMTYLRARAYAWASWAASTVVALPSAHAAKSVMACCSAKSQMVCGLTIVASTPSSLTHQRWRRQEAAACLYARSCLDTPSRCLTTSSQLGCCCATRLSLRYRTAHMTPTVCASALPRAGDPATRASSSPPAHAGSKSSSTTTDNTQTNTETLRASHRLRAKRHTQRQDKPHKLSQISST